MNKYIYVLFLIVMIIAPAAGQKGNEFKEFYYPPASKLFDARHYFETLQYYNDELAIMQLKTAIATGSSPTGTQDCLDKPVLSMLKISMLPFGVLVASN